MLRQVSPWRSSPGNSQDRVEEFPVVCGRTASIPNFTGKHRPNPFPLLIAQSVSFQAGAPFASLESDLPPKGNPLMSTRLRAFR